LGPGARGAEREKVGGAGGFILGLLVLIGNPCCEGLGAHKNVICQLQVALSALIKLLTSFERTLRNTQTNTHTHRCTLNILDKCKWALYYQCRHARSVESKTGRTTELEQDSCLNSPASSLTSSSYF